MPPEPSGESRLIQLSAGEGEDQYHDFFLRGFDAKPVEPEEEVHGLECDTLAAVYEGMVVGEPESTSCSQGRKVRVRVAVEPISGTLESRLQESAGAKAEGPTMGLDLINVPVRRFVLSVPERLRPFLHHRPRTAGAVLHILLRALQATLREACPTAPALASFGVVSFLHRFGSSLNPQFIELRFALFDGLAEALLGALRALPHRPLGSTSTSS